MFTLCLTASALNQTEIDGIFVFDRSKDKTGGTATVLIGSMIFYLVLEI